jgi:hypothetical protein
MYCISTTTKAKEKKMARVKKYLGSFDMEVTYAVTETTTHKTTLKSGTVIRSDLNGLYISENPQGQVTSSWLGNKDFFPDLNGFWAFPSKSTLNVEDCNWEEDTFERKYTMYKDVS